MGSTKADYLKRYLSKDKQQPKKTSSSRKQLKTKSSRGSSKYSQGLKIVDEDSSLCTDHFCEAAESSRSRQVSQADDPCNADDFDEPVVVLVNNRVDELKLIGKFKSSTWNTIDDDSSASTAFKTVKMEPVDDVDFEESRRKRHDSSDSDQSVERKSHPKGTFYVKPDPDSSKYDKPKKSGEVKRLRHDSSDSDLSVERHRSGAVKSEPANDKIRRQTRKEKTGSAAGKSGVSSDSDMSVEREKSRSKKSHAVLPKRRNSSDSDLSVKRNFSGSFDGQETKIIPSQHKFTIKSVPGITKSGLADLEDSVPIKRRDQYDKHKGRKKKRELTEEEKKRQDDMKRKYEVWNKGLKQVNERQQKLDEMASLIDKPLARYRDDRDLDAHLKNQLLDEDPMAEYIAKKAAKSDNGSQNLQQQKPKYRGQAPANRYGLLPGYRWDSVDRSNGFEAKLLSQANVKKAEQEEFYAWSSGMYE